MFHRFRASAVMFGLAAVLLSTHWADGQTRTPRPKWTKPAARKPLPPSPAIPPSPPPPPTLEQMAPLRPQVTYRNGLLTIVAQNSLLRDILSAVRAYTGAVLETPPDLGNDRVIVHLGPASPSEVLSSLFEGSRFDYIIVGSPDDPNALQRVILTIRTSPPASQSAGIGAPGVGPGPGQTAPFNPAMNAAMPVEQVEPDSEPEQPEPVPPQSVEPQIQPANPAMPLMPGQPQFPGQPNPSQPQVRTPEQLLQELQRIQREQQQQQQQQQQKPNQQ